MKRFDRVVCIMMVVLASVAVIAPAVAKGVGVPGDVYGIPDATTMVIVMTIGSTVIEIDGVEGRIDAGPQITWDRTLAPIRPIIEALGGTIAWNSTSRTVTTDAGEKTIVLVIGRNYALVSGRQIYLDANRSVVPYIQAPGRTMLPVRFIAEQLGALVTWDAVLRRVTLVFARP
jgi:hypothetical protein